LSFVMFSWIPSLTSLELKIWNIFAFYASRKGVSRVAPREKLADFLMNLPSGLECLSLSQVVGRIPISLMAITHGMTLRSLVLQESSLDAYWYDQRWTRQPTRRLPHAIGRRSQFARHGMLLLETLLLDMPRTTEWVSLGPDLCNSSLLAPKPLLVLTWAYQPSDHLDALARLPTLRSLTLYSATNTNPHDQTTNPAQQILQVNKSTARDLFLRLRAAKQGLPLESCTSISASGGVSGTNLRASVCIRWTRDVVICSRVRSRLGRWGWWLGWEGRDEGTLTEEDMLALNSSSDSYVRRLFCLFIEQWTQSALPTLGARVSWLDVNPATSLIWWLVTLVRLASAETEDCIAAGKSA
jgi:hypothetical protein